MSITEGKATALRDALERDILMRIQADSALQDAFALLHPDLLGARMNAQFGPAGRAFAQSQTARLVPQFAPRYMELPSADALPRLTQIYVLSLFVLAREAFSVSMAMSCGRAPFADALGQQLLAISPAPLDWVEPLRILRADGSCPVIVGAFPDIEEEPFNVVLLTTLAAASREPLRARQ